LLDDLLKSEQEICGVQVRRASGIQKVGSSNPSIYNQPATPVFIGDLHSLAFAAMISKRSRNTQQMNYRNLNHFASECCSVHESEMNCKPF